MSPASHSTPMMESSKSETDTSGTRPNVRIQRKTWEMNEQTDLFEALNEALDCTKCTLEEIEPALAADIDSGAYKISQYPPYFLNHSRIEDEKVSPLDPEPKYRENSIWKVITLSQRQRYYELVEQHLNRELDRPVKLDTDISVVIAHYYVDAHIQRHYLDRRSMLALCRDEEDLEDLREWCWAMAEKCSIHYPDIVPYPVGDSKVEWPNDDNDTMAHQEITWRRTWRARKVRVDKVRAKWALIMAERRKQREALLAKNRDVLTVRLYCGGELRNVRKLKIYPEARPGPRMGRPTQSSGF